MLTGPRDLDLARKLVKASGYAGAPIVQMAATDAPALSALNLVAQAMMTEIGLNVVFQAMDFGTLLSRVNKGGQAGSNSWNCFCAAWPGPAVLDPGSHLPLFGPVPVRDPRMLALRDAWLDTPDLASQKTIADQMQLRAFEDPPFVPLGEFLACRRIARVCRASSVPMRRCSGTFEGPDPSGLKKSSSNRAEVARRRPDSTVVH